MQGFIDLEQIRKQKQVSPYLRDFIAVIYIAITTIILAYGTALGPISILVMYTLWLPKLASLFPLRREMLSVSLFPAFAILSSTWSDYPAHSLYSSLEYESLVICTMIIAKIVRTSTFIRGIVIGSVLVLLASIASGNYEIDPSSGKSALIGFFGSKNMVGLFAEIGIFLSLLSLFIQQSLIKKTLFSLLPLVVFTISIYLSKSASSVVSLMVMLTAVFATACITKIQRPLRTISFILLMFLAVMGAGISVAFNAQDAILDSFGKDSTLTGRTHLWAEALKSSLEAPILGHGYSAFWVEGQPKAEQLWAEFGVTAKVGFHFHNVFLETFVELGAVGVAILAFIMLANCWSSIHLLLRQGLSVDGAFALGISVMFLTRAMVEVDIIGTFSIGPLLFYSVIPGLKQLKRAAAFDITPPLP